MSDEGKWCLINPLSVRFSQPRINPYFRDGRLLDETSCEVYETSLLRPEEATTAPPYDVILVPPFPAIRVISWLPKMRRPDGEAERDEYGDNVLGKRAWFALDNRRLHSMQRAAAKRWPRQCCVAVRCLEEVPGGSTIRELRKFRTTTQGKSIDVGMRAGDSKHWSWVDDAPPGAREAFKATGFEVEPEGFFAEDLWDANTWASHAVAIASDARAADQERRHAGPPAEAQPSPKPEAQPVPQPPPPVVSQPQAQVFQEASPYPVAQPQPRPPRLIPCPPAGWQYIDPAGRIQGPFGLDKMRLWNQHGFFYPGLLMRSNAVSEFLPFSQLWPFGVLPFTSQVIEYRA